MNNSDEPSFPQGLREYDVTDQYANYTLSDTELFRWHGMELVYIPTVMLIGCLGNAVVFYIYQFRWRRSTATLVKRILACMDLATLMGTMPIVLYLAVNPRCAYFSALCKTASYVAILATRTSGCVLIIIAVDRYLKVCKGQTKGVSSKLLMKLFVACIIINALIEIWSLFMAGRDSIPFENYNIRTESCLIGDKLNATELTIYIAFKSVLFLVNVVVLITLYVLIFRVIRVVFLYQNELRRKSSQHSQHSRNGYNGNTENNGNNDNIGNNDISYTVDDDRCRIVLRNTSVEFLFVTVVFFISYTPYFIVVGISEARPGLLAEMSPGWKAVYDLCKLFPFLNSLANPFIYSFGSIRFRKELRKVFTIEILIRCKAFLASLMHSDSDSASYRVSETSEFEMRPRHNPGQPQREVTLPLCS